jgi:hypothetical protein
MHADAPSIYFAAILVSAQIRPDHRDCCARAEVLSSCRARRAEQVVRAPDFQARRHGSASAASVRAGSTVGDAEGEKRHMRAGQAQADELIRGTASFAYSVLSREVLPRFFYPGDTMPLYLRGSCLPVWARALMWARKDLACAKSDDPAGPWVASMAKERASLGHVLCSGQGGVHCVTSSPWRGTSG